jgi:hypothetical protein
MQLASSFSSFHVFNLTAAACTTANTTGIILLKQSVVKLL